MGLEINEDKTGVLVKCDVDKCGYEIDALLQLTDTTEIEIDTIELEEEGWTIKMRSDAKTSELIGTVVCPNCNENWDQDTSSWRG